MRPFPLSFVIETDSRAVDMLPSSSIEWALTPFEDVDDVDTDDADPESLSHDFRAPSFCRSSKHRYSSVTTFRVPPIMEQAPYKER